MKPGASFEILHELISHKGYINCMSFDMDGHLLFSGDSGGCIRVWETQSGSPNGGDDQLNMFWFLKKKLDFKELQDNPVTNLAIHPGNRRLLVQCKALTSPHPVLMIDLKLNCIMQTFSGSQNFRKPVGGCISPCGTHVFAGSQDGGVFVWNADTGKESKIFDKPFGKMAKSVQVNCIEYHPHDHIVAFSGIGQDSFGSPLPIVIYQFDRSKMKAKSPAPDDPIPPLPFTTMPRSISCQPEQLRKRPSLISLDPKLIDNPEDQESAEKFKSMLEKLDNLLVAKRIGSELSLGTQ